MPTRSPPLMKPASKESINYKLNWRASRPQVCPLWKLAPYTAPLAFADYWKDTTDERQYLARSRWLADMNNERKEKNEAYKQQMVRLERYVLVEALKDTIIAPHASESHGFYEWGDEKTVVPLKETQGYKEDFIGLKTLDDDKKLELLTYEGEHLGFTAEWWAKNILPHLA